MTPSVNEGFRDLYCPVTLEPMREAYSLVPCMDKISKAALLRLNPTYQENPQVSLTCPLCRRTVTAYPDRVMSNIVNTILGLEDGLPVACAKIAAEEMKVEELPPYPGKGAKLTGRSGMWQEPRDFGGGSPFVREIDLISGTSDSFLEKFSIRGHRDGSIMSSVRFRVTGEVDNKNLLKKYFGNPDLTYFIYSDVWGRYFSEGRAENEHLFRIVAENNEIPEEYFSLIRDLVKSDDWRGVS